MSRNTSDILRRQRMVEALRKAIIAGEQSGPLETINREAFKAEMRREPFDYTQWQKKLWLDKSIEDISSMAMTHQQKAAE